MTNIERGSNIVKLLYNIIEKNFEEVKKLIQPMSVDINCTDSNGNIPLHYAVYVEDVQIVKYLLENKADMFIENNDNETPFDIAVERENADIILVVGTEIINKSLEILKESEFETSPNTERNASNKESSNEEIIRTKRKISHLHKRVQAVMNNNGNLSYEQANLFILFLETFSLVCISKERKEEREKVIKYFYGNDENMKNNIGKMRSIILKRSEHSIIELDGVKYAIECCYNGQNDFFIDLNQYLESQLQRNDDLQCKNLHKINFLKMFPNSKKQNVVKNDTVTKEKHIMQLKYFVLNAYKDGVDWQQQWFEFVVNIYPGLGLNKYLEKEINHNYIVKQLMHLRNNLVHEFYRFGVEEFKETIINLRGKLLEYYLAEIVYNKFQSLVDPEEIEQSLNTHFEQLQKDFNMSNHSKLITNVVKIIEDINEAVNDCTGVNIIDLSEFIWNKNNESKELVFSDYINPNSKFKKLIEEHSKLMRLMDRVCPFNNVYIQVDNITLEINIKQTIGNIITIFYDAYNESNIEFNIKEIFSRESFLNELIWQDIKEETLMKQNIKSIEYRDKCTQFKTLASIYKLIDLEFMSPYIVKLIETTVQENKANNINKNALIKLIDNLLNTTEYDKYLNSLLNVELEGFKLYEILYDRILEKKINVKDISLIFEELVHLDKFIDVLLEKSTSIVEDCKKSSTPYNNDVIELIKSVVEIINQKACSKFESNEYKEESRIVLQILMKGREIEKEFVEILGENYPGFIERELLIVKIKNQNGDHNEALQILQKLEDILKSDTNISHNMKYLLILSDLAYTKSILDTVVDTELAPNEGEIVII